MTVTSDQKREILRLFIKDNGLKIAPWAKQSGVDKNSIYNFLNGHSNALDLRTYGKLARTAQVPVFKLTGEMGDLPAPKGIMVTGRVQAGAFSDAVEWALADQYSVDVPVPTRYQNVAKALEVVGPSMDKEYPDGSIVVWVDMLDARPVRDGDHVIVYCRARDDGIEATVKEYRLENGQAWLWPRSNHPEHQTPVNTQIPPDWVESIEIKGIVIGGYRPRML